MSYDFPANPAEGQAYQPSGGPRYVYRAPAWVVESDPTVGNFNRLDIADSTSGEGKPFAPVSGMLSIHGLQLRLWADMSASHDGDYDADVASKSNMYLVAGGGIQLLPSTNSYLPWNADGTIQPNGTTGRLRIASDLVANYIQSGGNYNGDWFKDLIITRYNTSSPWMIFDESRSGYVGIGYLFPKAEEIVNGIPRQLWQVGARLHVINSAQTVALFEAPQDGSARIAFKDQATAVPPTVGSSGDDLLLRTHDLARARVTSNSFQPGVDNYHSLGSSAYRWLNVNTNLVNLPHRTAPASPVNGDMWTETTGLFVRVNGATVGPLGSGGGAGVTDGDKGDIVVSGTGASWLFDSSVVTAAAKTVLDDTTTAAMLATLGAAPLAGATFTGKVVTPASAAGGAGLNLGVGVAPSSPVAGDVWIDSNNTLTYRSNTTRTVVDLATTQTISGTKTFSVSPILPTPAAADNSTKGATTAYVDAADALKANATHTHAESDITNLVTDLAAKAALAGATFTGKVNTPASTAGNAGLSVGGPSNVAPSSPVTGDLWGTNTAFFYRGSSATYQFSLLSTAETYTGIKTFSAKPIMATPAAGTASVNLPHGTTPSAPANGDVWTESTGMYARINGVTIGPFGATGAGGIADAPNDGSTYGRKNLGWVVLSGGGGITEAPTDSKLYARFNSTWNDLTDDFAAKAATVHTHAESDVTNLVTDLAAKAALAGATFTGPVILPASIAGAASLNLGAVGTAPSSPVAGDVWLAANTLNVRYGGTTTPLVNTTSNQSIAGIKTFSAKLGTMTPTTASASIALPHGVAPSAPVDGDLWTSTAGLFVRVNGATVGPLATAGAAAEPPISAGTTAQYWRGDKSWQTLDKAAVGLGNVDNTADTAKPVSTAQATAIGLKLDATHAGTGGTAHANVVAAGAAGFMTGADKTKLDGIASGATAYVHPSGDGNLHVPATGTGSNGMVLKAGSTAGSGAWAALTKTDVGLTNVDNTSDANKPLSTANTAALALKADLASPTFTGDPKAPTPLAADNDTSIATTAFVKAQGYITGATAIANSQLPTRLQSQLSVADVDLNLCVDTGWYNIAAATPNSPLSGAAGACMVMTRFSYILQFAYQGHASQYIAFYRSSSNAGAAWGSWVPLPNQAAMDLKANLATPTFTGPVNVTGDFIASGNVTAYSDARTKQDIQPLEDALATIIKLRGVSFVQLGRDGRNIGVVAQELEEVLPELVLTGENGMKSVAYGNLAAVLIEAVKELSSEVKTLRGTLH